MRINRKKANRKLITMWIDKKKMVEEKASGQSVDTKITDYWKDLTQCIELKKNIKFQTVNYQKNHNKVSKNIMHLKVLKTK